jgi:hypothetical protein
MAQEKSVQAQTPQDAEKDPLAAEEIISLADEGARGQRIDRLAPAASLI